MNDDFEKYWQQQFESFKVTPSDNLWDKLNNSLFEKQSQSLFKQFMVEPSKQVWRIIALKLWWKRFIHFSPTHFNIYYSLVALLTSLTFIFWHQTTVRKHSFKHNIEAKQSLNTTRSLYAQLNNLITENEHKLNDTKRNYQPEKKPIPYENQFFSANESDLSKINKPSISLINSTEINENFKTRYLTYYNKRNQWSIGISFAPALYKHSLIIQKQSEDKIDKYLKLQNTLSYSVGVWLNRTIDHWNYETGLLISSIRQNFTFNDAHFIYDTIHNINILDNSYYQYSNIQIINLDTLLLTGDTVWINYIDSTLVPVFDTVYQTEIKGKRIDNKAMHYFSYRTIELPLMIGYTHRLDRFSLTWKAGISLAYSMVSIGKLPSYQHDYGAIPIHKEYFRAWQINTLFAAEMQYFIKEQWSVSFMPAYKRTLTNMISSAYPGQLKCNAWIFYLGIKYSLP
ncbi:MAG: hypothetical protein N2449_02730 [Bacteroidales bacterium]|nr:hypothetical protein [Bacteroidales bacterium]